MPGWPRGAELIPQSRVSGQVRVEVAQAGVERRQRVAERGEVQGHRWQASVSASMRGANFDGQAARWPSQWPRSKSTRFVRRQVAEHVHDDRKH